MTPPRDDWRLGRWRQKANPLWSRPFDPIAAASLQGMPPAETCPLQAARMSELYRTAVPSAAREVPQQLPLRCYWVQGLMHSCTISLALGGCQCQLTCGAYGSADWADAVDALRTSGTRSIRVNCICMASRDDWPGPLAAMPRQMHNLKALALCRATRTANGP